MLETLDLDVRLDRTEYRQRRDEARSRLLQLQRACHEASLASVTVFAGWDASGRGTTIRKLTQRLEPRAYRLHLVQAPRTSATLLPWMWRFWRLLPEHGTMGIFHRSWYSEVIEGRALRTLDERSWLRACRDIRFFERTLAESSTVVTKFFLHLSKKEQDRRFAAREATEHKRWKLTDEDWRNRGKRDLYEEATEDMLTRTSTLRAPWSVVAGEDKRWARVETLRVVTERLREYLAGSP